MPLSRALFEYTNFYIRFGLGRDFDPDHPGWQAYLTGLRDEVDGPAWTSRYYRSQHATGSPPVAATFGCFSYARLDDHRIRLHFRNAEGDGRSPLALERKSQRLAELAALFE